MKLNQDSGSGKEKKLTGERQSVLNSRQLYSSEIDNVRAEKEMKYMMTSRFWSR